MMHNSGPVAIPLPAWLPAAMVDLAEAWTKKIAKINEARSEIEAERQAIASDPLNFIATGKPLSVRTAQIDRDELQVRREVPALVDRLEKARAAVEQAAHRAHEDARGEAMKAALAAGFLDPATNPLSRSRVLPGDINRHPRVHAARNHVAEVRAYVSTLRDFANLNAVRLTELEAAIRKSVLTATR